MNINGIGGANATTALTLNDTQRTPSSIPPAASGPAATASISTPGELFAKLQDLQTKDPTQFKQIVSGIATSLRDSAQKIGGGPGADRMNDLADRFDKAAQTGDLSAATAPSGTGGAQHAHHHGHGHHKGGGGGISDILQNALTQVNQALDQDSTTSTTATPTTTAPVTND